MSETRKRKVHTPKFKARVGLEALRGEKTINEIDQEHGCITVRLKAVVGLKIASSDRPIGSKPA